MDALKTIVLASGVLLIISLFALWRGLVIAGCVLAGLALGVFCAGSHAYNLQGMSFDSESGQQQFVMIEDATASHYGGASGMALIVEGDDAGRLVEVSFSRQEDLLLFGQAFTSDTCFRKPSKSRSKTLWQKGCVSCVTVNEAALGSGPFVLLALSRLRSDAITTVEGSDMAPSLKAVFQALTCGYRVNLQNDQIYDAFKRDGLAHVVAVSGAHLSVVVMLLESLLATIGLGRKIRIGLEATFIMSFLLFAATPISALRASAMALASLASFFPGRRSSSLSAIGILIMVLCAVSPASLCSISMLLSAGSTIGIVLFASLTQAWISRLFRFPNFVEESLALTFSSALVTGPVSACLFSQVSFVSALANILVAPIFSLACGLGLLSLMVSLAVPGISAIALLVGSFPTGMLCLVVQGCSLVPYACVPFSGSSELGVLASVVISVILILVWPQTFRAIFPFMATAAFILALTVLPALLPSSPKIVMMDVGQGDAILVKDGFHTLLVDTGTNDSLVRQALARQGVAHLDAVLITHGDDDHDGSLLALTQVVEIDAVYVAKDALDCSCKNCVTLRSYAQQAVGFERVIGLEKGDVFDCGRFRVSVLWPQGFSDEGGNGDSLCLRIGLDIDKDGLEDGSALLVGDAESQVLDQLTGAEGVGTVDVYKVAHHGSKAAVSENALSVLKPAISLISVGEGNRYGHPAQNTLDSLRNAGSEVFRTDEQGDIICEFRKRGIEVSAQK